MIQGRLPVMRPMSHAGVPLTDKSVKEAMVLFQHDKDAEGLALLMIELGYDTWRMLDGMLHSDVRPTQLVFVLHAAHKGTVAATLELFTALDACGYRLFYKDV